MWIRDSQVVPECANDVCVDDIREGVASLGEPADVILQGLAGLLLAALEVPGVTRVDICPLEIFDEDPLEVCLVAYAIVQKEFKPCPNMLPHANGKILNDEIVIIHSSDLAGELEVFEPNAWVYLLGVFGDVGGRSETLREWYSLNKPAEGPWPRALRAGAPVVWPVTAPGARFTTSLDGLAGVRVACCRMVDVIIVSSLTPVVDDAACILVLIGPLVYRRLVWTRRQVGPWRDCRTPTRA